MENLDTLLAGEEPVEKNEAKENFGFDELHISQYAFDKAFRYAQLVIEAKRRNVEVGGFLTAPKDAQDRIARDAFLARDQEVRVGFYKLEAPDVLKAGKELDEQGQKIIGWWHSHGRFKTFHSDTDKKNQMVLLNQISPSNYAIAEREREFSGLQSSLEGDNLVFWDPKNSATRYELELRGADPEIVASRLRVLEQKRIGFAYSFVVNWHRWLRYRVPYCEIATRDLCRNCNNANDASVEVGYKLFDTGEYVLDNEQLMAEINERVHVEGDYRGTKTYFLPQTFEAQRAAGTLKEPNFGPEVRPSGTLTKVYSQNPDEPSGNAFGEGLDLFSLFSPKGKGEGEK